MHQKIAHLIVNFDNISSHLKENNVQWVEYTTDYKEFKENKQQSQTIQRFTLTADYKLIS
jgi:hypothetical protein